MHARPFIEIAAAALFFGIVAAVKFGAIWGFVAGFGLCFVGFYLAAFLDPFASSQ